VNLISSSLGSLFGVLDDLSYYSYHQRNYSQVVAVFFGELTDFTLMKWAPKDILDFFDRMNFKYSDKILTHNLK
jgi:hypothetical protein